MEGGIAIVDGDQYVIAEIERLTQRAGGVDVYVHAPGDPGRESLLMKRGGRWTVYGLDEPVTVEFPVDSGSLDLALLFDNACRRSKSDRQETWRIAGVPCTSLNHLRKWLERDVRSVAIAWMVVDTNTGMINDQVLGERVGLIPLVADPGELSPFEGDADDAGSVLQFDLVAENTGDTTMDVTTDYLQWVPLGDQQDRFTMPRALYPDQVITVLPPGGKIDATMFATNGTGRDNAAWIALHAHYRAVDTRRRAPQVETSLVRERTLNPDCEPCDEIDVRPCFHFVARLIGGVTFDQVQAQLETRFEWGEYDPHVAETHRLPPV